MPYCKHCVEWVKPLKRSQKVRLRKELEKRKKEEQNNPKLEGNKWVFKL